ncbi:MAG: choice-of-anchor D domain-containing protein [Thermoanaerobaculia bacterium]
MKKIFIFITILLFSFVLKAQVLAPAADGHILRNETFIFDQSNPNITYGGNTTYFIYFQNLYVGGEDSFTADFDPNDGRATHYNRELRTILEFDISSLNLTPNSFSAFLKVTTDGNFWPTQPNLTVEAYDQNPAQENGAINLNDYSSNTTLQEALSMDALNFGKTYSFNVTNALNSDITASRDYSGFVLIPNPRNGNEISFISSWEDPSGTGKPKLEITSLQPDINVSIPASCSSIVGTQNNLQITITNVGQGTLTIDSITETQDPSGYYSLNLNGLDNSLAPQESTSFYIIFSPQSTGNFFATFRISSNDPDENPYDFTLNCQATSSGVPVIEVEVPLCENVPTYTSSCVEITIKNTGTSTLQISSITEVQDTLNVYEIDLTGINYSVPAGGQTKFKIIFSPTTPGTYTGTFKINSNDPQKPSLEFSLTCSAISSTAPDIEVSPTEIFWNNIPVNTNQTQIITVRNKSANPEENLNISSVILSGDSVYSLDTSELKLNLKPGEQTTFKINLSSQNTGVFKGTVSVNSNDPDSPTVLVSIISAVTLSGIGQNPVNSTNGYIIPASALAYGAYGSRWVTDVKIHNPENKNVSFRIFYLPTQINNSVASSGDFTLGSNQTLSIPNILRVLFGLTDGVGAILVTLLENPLNLLITSRTYNLTSQGTYGQFIKGYPVSRFISSGTKGYLLGLQKDSRMRTNVGFNSLSEGANFKITLINGNGTNLASKEISLPPNSHLQINDIFGDLQVQGNSNSYAIVEVLSGKVFSYASVVNNQSSDPIFVPMQ